MKIVGRTYLDFQGLDPCTCYEIRIRKQHSTAVASSLVMTDANGNIIAAQLEEVVHELKPAMKSRWEDWRISHGHISQPRKISPQCAADSHDSCIRISCECSCHQQPAVKDAE